jgi:hypothetical protein
VRFFIILGLLFLNVIPFVAFSADLPPGKQTNGCGSGTTEFLVPDKIGKCNLTEACDRHDVCYGKCLEGGELFGSNACNASEQEKERRKQKCDASLYDDIALFNQGNCRAWASLYKFFVVHAGGGFFNGMTTADLEKIIDTSKTPDEALSKLEYLKVLDKADVLDFRKIQQMDGAVSLPTRRPIPEVKAYKNGQIIIPKNFKATTKNLELLRQQVEKR